MNKKKSFKFSDPSRERQVFLNRIRVVKLVTLCSFFLLASRVLYLQVIAHERFAARSESNRVHLQAIVPHRGQIRDYKGQLLATNKQVQSVFFSPALARESKADFVEVIQAISKILNLLPVDAQEIHQRLSLRGKKNQNFLIKENISTAEHAKLIVRRHQLPGLVIDSSSSRYYPYNEAFSHAIGYLGLIAKEDIDSEQFDQSNYRATQQIGKNGVERYYESLLHGTVGWQKVEVDARGRVHRVLDRQQPVHGSDLRLGLDGQLQYFAWYKMQNKRGSIVAIEPKTGRILLLISAPSFDPNIMVRGIDSTTYQKLISTKSRLFFNRFAKGRYPPASTIKPIYALTGLQAGIIDPDTTIYDRGYFQVDGDDHRYRNWFRRGHGKVNLDRAMRVSNDTYFFTLAEQLGYNLLAQSLQQFGFGRKVSLDVFGESELYIANPNWKYVRFGQPWVTGDNINMGIGQGFVLSTPLQLAAMTSVIANRGKWIRPRLLFGIDNMWVDNWENAAKFDDVQIDDIHWDTVINSMVSVTNNPEGTAFRAARASKHIIAGKTGTAQVINLSRDHTATKYTEYTKDHALFIGFAPVEEPKIAIAVILENGGSGGADAAPIAVDIINQHLDNNLALSKQ